MAVAGDGGQGMLSQVGVNSENAVATVVVAVIPLGLAAEILLGIQLVNMAAATEIAGEFGQYIRVSHAAGQGDRLDHLHIPSPAVKRGIFQLQRCAPITGRCPVEGGAYHPVLFGGLIPRSEERRVAEEW